jgi:ferric-dicitrate binding protein FerR (iron transport regulator)
MANLSRPSAHRQILAREPARPLRLQPRRAAVVVLALVAGLAALAWFDGGEEPLHPIAQPVELPGAGQ